MAELFYPHHYNVVELFYPITGHDDVRLRDLGTTKAPIDFPRLSYYLDQTVEANLAFSRFHAV
jgi:hypothetical protein